MAEKTNVTRELSRLQKTLVDLQEEVAVLSQEVSNRDKNKPLTKRASLFLRSLLGFVADASSLIIPAATFYLAFSNFVSIPPSHSLHPKEPLIIPFVVQNNSYINLRDVTVNFNIIYINGDGDGFKNITYNNSKSITKTIYNTLPMLSANSSNAMMFNASDITPYKFTKITRADIQIEISYKALFFPKSFVQTFRFIATPKQDGIYEYYPAQSKI